MVARGASWRTRRMVVCTACLIVAAAAGAPPARAQQDGPGRSAKELWDDYPLRERTARPSPAATTTAPPVRAAAAPDDDDGSSAAPLLIVLLGIAGAVALLLLVRRDLGTAPGAAARTGSVVPSTPRAPVPSPTWAAAPAPAPAAGGQQRLVPPDPARRWTAEVELQEGDGTAWYAVVARGDGGATATLARTEPVAWRAGDARAEAAMAAGSRTLRSDLRAAGWDPLPRGDAPYATRCIWRPRGAPANGRDATRTEELNSG